MCYPAFLSVGFVSLFVWEQDYAKSYKWKHWFGWIVRWRSEFAHLKWLNFSGDPNQHLDAG